MENNSYQQICNLLYRYAELMDSGDLTSAASLFEHAAIKNGSADNKPRNHKSILAIWQKMVILYPDGTPSTRHLINNPIIEIDEDNGTATCRSCYTVLQCTDKLPLQIIASGRYHDEFARMNGQWRFASRDYSLLDMRGDMSQHLNFHQFVQPSVVRFFAKDDKTPSWLKRFFKKS